jgi:methyl acetate hydrolase
MGGTSMNNNLQRACDAILQKVATGKDRVPGVVAMITDRSANVYEGAAGERILGACPCSKVQQAKESVC